MPYGAGPEQPPPKITRGSSYNPSYSKRPLLTISGRVSVCDKKKSCITKEMFFRIREGVFLLALCKTFPSKRRMIKNTLHPGPLKKQNLVMLAKKRL